MKSLRIQNFQAHEDLRVEFGDDITSIVGPSDAGKSAVIRALRWLMTNEPRGDGFIRDGAKFAKVTLELGNGTTIVRERGGSTNVYRMDDQEYVAFGNEVPIDIANALNVSPLNFQGQHDSPFWFAETAGEVSRQLNQIVDLDIIDSTLSNIDSAVRKTRTEVEVCKDRMEGIEAKGKSLSWVKKSHSDLMEVEKLDELRKEKAAESLRLNDLTNIVTRYHEIAENASQAIADASTAIEKGIVWKDERKALESLSSAVEKLEKLSAIADQPIPPSLKPLEKMAKELQEQSASRKSLERMISKIEEGHESLCQKESELNQSTKQLKKELGNQCPLCGNPIKS